MKTALSTGLFSLLLVVFVCQVKALPATTSIPDNNQVSEKGKDSGSDVEETAAALSTKEDKLGPISVFADIEAAWRAEKVNQILQHYGQGKVGIAIAGTGPTGGAFSRSQSHYLFKDLFKYTITEKFEFVQYRQVTDGTEVYAVAERFYKKNDDGRLFKDKIYVSLHLEDDRWVISEIKSIR